jgi:hypothetical protein
MVKLADMKKAERFSLATLLLALIPMVALADCYTLLDGDARTLCQARQRNDPGQCYAIQNADQRTACLAEFRQDRYLCTGIQDLDERMRCEMGAQRPGR